MENVQPVTETELQSKAVAPRVTAAEIEAQIAGVYFLNAGDAIRRADQPISDTSPAQLLTLCVLVLKNGFTVTGESACASPENFDAEIGRRLARTHAVSKLWPLLGFRLRDKITSQYIWAAAVDAKERRGKPQG